MIGWRDEKDEIHRGSLFAVFAALSCGEAWSFPALRPHQREPWHAFTVQVAALALIRAGRTELPADEAGWRDLLLALTDGQPEPWELVVDDWTKPALLQPPVRTEQSRAKYRAGDKEVIRTPDGLDIVLSAKNHDIKKGLIGKGNEEDWLFALVACQTASAFGGNKTFGISRMNSTTGSRFIVRARPGGGASRSFVRDVKLLRESARHETKKALVWLEPFDDEKDIFDFTKLSPSLYIDCARRVRLRRTRDTIEALTATSDVPRILSEPLCGVTHDPYAPIAPEGDKSITPKRNTFGYKRISEILSGSLPLLATVHDSDESQGLSINFSAMVREGGTDFTTKGYLERRVPTSRISVIAECGSRFIHDRIGDTAQARATAAGLAAGKLERSLLALFQGAASEDKESGRIKIDFKDKISTSRVKPWIDQFDLKVDQIFFDKQFWSQVADDPAPHDRLWRERLRKIAEKVFDAATDAAPGTEMRRVRARARSRYLLDIQMNKWLREVGHDI